eukprot:673485-Amphidinium_carterae.1
MPAVLSCLWKIYPDVGARVEKHSETFPVECASPMDYDHPSCIPLCTATLLDDQKFLHKLVSR